MELTIILGVITTYLLTLTTVASYRSNSNEELLNALHTRPGSVLIINSQNRTHSTNITSDNSTAGPTGVRAIRFDGEWIHQYSEYGSNFIRDDNSPQHFTRTRDQIPANVTSAVIGPDGDIYFFSGDKHCKRKFSYRGTPKYCPMWESNSVLFGCESNDTSIALCANTTICGISSNKTDRKNSIKFVYQGKTRWILTINLNNTRTGSVVQDVHYVPRVEKIASNITAPSDANITSAANETKGPLPPSSDSTVHTAMITNSSHPTTIAENISMATTSSPEDASLKQVHHNASSEAISTHPANLTAITSANETHVLNETTILPIVTTSIPLLLNESNNLINSTTLLHSATLAPLEALNHTSISLNETAIPSIPAINHTLF